MYYLPLLVFIVFVYLIIKLIIIMINLLTAGNIVAKRIIYDEKMEELRVEEILKRQE